MPSVVRCFKAILVLTLLIGIGNKSWAFDPLVGQIRQDPTRQMGLYRVELARSKQDQLDRFQRVLDESGSVEALPIAGFPGMRTDRMPPAREMGGGVSDRHDD